MQIPNQMQLLEALEKGITTGDITAIVPEDLEVEAHNTLWDETDPGELTLMKMLPTVKATQVVHQFSKVTSYGNKRNSGFFSERSLPPETQFTTVRETVNIRLMGEIGPTFLLAALEKTQQALGTSGAQNIERVALRKNVLFKKNRNLYFSDTTKTRLGTGSQRFKGILQQIREGTDGTTGTSRYGSHVIDMEGQPLVVDTIRDRLAKSQTLFGMFTSLIMDPMARSDFEASMDGATRLPMPLAAKPYAIGQQIAGIQTQGGVTWFETDNTLSAIYAQEQYTTDVAQGAPTTLPTVGIAVGAPGGSRVSKWDAASAGNIYWVVTEVVDEVEGLGRRAPASSYQAVAAGQEVTLTITPGTPNADSFRVYRGTDDDAADTDAFFIYEVAGAGSGAAVTSYDDNLYRPNTTCAFGLNIKSEAERALHNGMADSYWTARDKSASFLDKNDRKGNTVAVAELGPSMGIMALASVLAHVDRPLVYSACAPEVRNPLQQVAFINIGRA